ncbi:MAG: PAS domain-containing protein [Actinomycetota bacterium]
MGSSVGDAQSGVRLSVGFMDALFERAPTGLGLWDRELRYVRLNEALAAMNGPTVEEHLGRRLREVIPDLAGTLEPLYGRVLDTGEPVIDIEVSGETPAQPGRRRYWQASYYPIFEAEAVAGVGALVLEVTDRVRARQQLERQAMQIYDDVVQALTVAKMGLEIGHREETVYATVARALAAAKHLTSRLLAERQVHPPDGGRPHR